MPPKAIPDRWIPYKACGDVIEGTRFICFKVPLRQNVQKNIPEIKKIWDIPTVLAEIPKLGAVIDLTNTARYYDPQDFLKANVVHRKILMPGRIIPPESTVKQFMDAADEFLGKDGESLVGVHCTHGLNRTGYMVCRYMRDRMSIPAQEAITRFEVARGYQIERAIYRNGILGTKKQPTDVAKETEVIPIESRRYDMNYRSPLGNDRESYKVESNRFGNSRYNNDRSRHSSFTSHGNSNSTNNSNHRNGLYSCYINRYRNDRNDTGPSHGSDRNRRSEITPLSWRNKGESSRDRDRDSQRSNDDSGYFNNRRNFRSRRRDD